MKRAVVVLLGAVTLLAVGLPLYSTQTEYGSQACSLGGPEGSLSSLDGWSWWLVGTRCSLVLPTGERLTQVVPPWRGTADWPTSVSVEQRR